MRSGGGPPVAHPVRVAAALLALTLAACGGSDMDMSEQKTTLEEAVTAAAGAFGIETPAAEAVRCDEVVERGHQRWEAGGGAEADPGQLDDLLAEVRTAWEDMGFDVDLSTLDDGSQPGLFATRGEVRVSASSGPPQGDVVGVSIGGSTECGDLG